MRCTQTGEQDFWGTHHDEAEDKHFQVFEPACLRATHRQEGRVLKMPEASHRWVKKPALESGKGNFSV